MALNFDIDQVFTDVKAAVTGVLGKDIETWRGFSERQGRAMVKQAQLIAQGFADGSLTNDDVDFFIDGLENAAENFARTLRGLVAITIEKVWNATMKVLLGAVKGALGGIGKAIPGI